MRGRHLRRAPVSLSLSLAVSLLNVCCTPQPPQMHAVTFLWLLSSMANPYVYSTLAPYRADVF